MGFFTHRFEFLFEFLGLDEDHGALLLQLCVLPDVVLYCVLYQNLQKQIAALYNIWKQKKCLGHQNPTG